MSRVKVLITDGIAENGLDLLKQGDQFDLDVRKATSPDELEKIIGDYDCVVIRSATTLTEALIRKGKSLKLIVRAGAGVDNIAVPVATELKIPVMNTASANSLAAAEQTIALLFAMFRKIPQAMRSLQNEKWDRNSFKGYEVTGKTLGVIGLGHIGQIVAEKAIGLGMQVLGFDPSLQDMSQLPKLARHEESVSLSKSVEDLLPKVDVLTLHVPKSEATKNLINEKTLGLMKKGSFLINCARGGVVKEADVLAALESGQLEGAAFDVFEKEPPSFPNPLFQHDQVIVVPHLGASTHEAQKRVASTAAQQMIGFFQKNERTGIINL